MLSPKDTLQLAYSVLTENQKKRFEMEDELDFSFGIQNLARFRGNVFKQRGCVSMVMRQIPFAIKTFDDLHLPPVIAQMAEKPRGLVLVTGPTGSGKSTTLAAMIDKINRERKGHIITVEDPIEFIHRHQGCIVNQREVGTDTKSFAGGAEVRAAAGPRRRPDRRNARPRDDPGRADDRRDGPPGLRDAAHQLARPRPSTASSTSFPAHQQSQVRAQLAFVLEGIITQMLLPKAERQGPRDGGGDPGRARRPSAR